MSGEEYVRMRTLQVVVLIVFGVIAARLCYLQLFETKYAELAKANALRREVLYPPRGEVYDRNGEFLVQSRECYDLMVVSRDIDRRGFDTALLCSVTGIPREKLEKELRNAAARHHQDHGCDDGRNFDLRDQHPIPCPCYNSCQNRHQHGDGHVTAICNNTARDRAADGHHRADGNIGPPGGQNERHAGG